MFGRSQLKKMSKYSSGKSNWHKWLASLKILSVEELETLPAGGIKAGEERRGKKGGRRSNLKGRDSAIVSHKIFGIILFLRQHSEDF